MVYSSGAAFGVYNCVFIIECLLRRCRVYNFVFMLMIVRLLLRG